ncbi:Cell division control protein 48 [Giardia muris]|uniref:Cell division control protein 48 n=1 Tax=Giardia muris TaxID=5742 RepID=A0A4Z1SN24_GIAMU|nr:Cell division control protein 48 [Giardia muris]|eukprot:TNJ27134.1 Cell division control protein 48 [Giardia muris]
MISLLESRKDQKKTQAPGLKRGAAVGAVTAVPIWPMVFVPYEYLGPQQSRYCLVEIYPKKGPPITYPRVVELRGAPIANGYFGVPETSPHHLEFDAAATLNVVTSIPEASIHPLSMVHLLGLESCSQMGGRLEGWLQLLLDGLVFKGRTTVHASIAGHEHELTLVAPDGIVDYCSIISRTRLNLTSSSSEASSTVPLPTGVVVESLESTARVLLDAIRAYFSTESLTASSALLYGSPGNGKTIFAQVAAAILRVPLLTVDTFQAVRILSRAPMTSGILFIDEVDSAQSTETYQQLGDLLKKPHPNLFVIAATNRLESLPDFLLNSSAFTLRCEFTPPSFERRVELLRTAIEDHRYVHHAPKENMVETDASISPSPSLLESIATRLEGFSYADIGSFLQRLRVHTEAKKQTLDTLIDSINSLLTTMRPSSLKSFNAVKARHVALGGLDVELQALLRLLSARQTRTALVYGPPGCGKSQLGRYLASSLNYMLLPVASTELIGSYVGETEKAISHVFRIAHTTQPLILFWDEIDAAFPGGSEVHTERSVSTFCDCLDGIDATSIFLLAATNRPEAIHPRILSRFSHRIEIRKPDTLEKVEQTLQSCLSGIPLAIDLEKSIPDFCGRLLGQTGAEIAMLVQRTSDIAIRRCAADPESPEILTAADMEEAFALTC